MIAFTDQIVVSKSIEETFDYASNMENSPKILANVVEVTKMTDGPIGQHTKFKEVREIRGKKAEATIEYISFSKNKSYSARSALQGLETIYHYEFSEAEGGTRIDFSCEVNTKGLKMRFIRPFFIKILKQEDSQHLTKLKDALEANS
ncbi:SRPBCC family protein [Cytobacillus sp. Hm23]